jgi:hypothetical protein
MSRLIYFPPPPLVSGSQAAYGALLVADGIITQVINIAPSKMTGWDSVSESSLNVTLDAADDSITVLLDGIYAGGVSIAFSGSAAMTVELHLRVDGLEQPEGTHRRLSGGDVGSASFQITPAVLTAGQVLTVWAEAQADTQNFLPVDAQFSIFRIG